MLCSEITTKLAKHDGRNENECQNKVISIERMVSIIEGYIRYKSLPKLLLELLTLLVALAILLHVQDNTQALCLKYDNLLPDDICDSYLVSGSSPTPTPLTHHPMSESPTPVPKVLVRKDADILRYLGGMYIGAIAAIILVIISIPLNLITTVLLINEDHTTRMVMYGKRWLIVLNLICMFLDINALMLLSTLGIAYLSMRSDLSSLPPVSSYPDSGEQE